MSLLAQGVASDQEPTLLFPPPGTWLMLPREPTFDWALNSSFSDLISTFPPPAGESVRQFKSNKQSGNRIVIISAFYTVCV